MKIYKILKISILIWILFLVSCSTAKNNFYSNDMLTGEYIATNTLTFRDILNMRARIIGISLSLHKDSTFQMSKCGREINGQWELKRDSLFLHCHSIRFTIDSFNMNPAYSEILKCNKRPEILKIKKNGLIIQSKYYGKRRAILDLRKME